MNRFGKITGHLVEYKRMYLFGTGIGSFSASLYHGHKMKRALKQLSDIACDDFGKTHKHIHDIYLNRPPIPPIPTRETLASEVLINSRWDSRYSYIAGALIGISLVI